MQSWITYFRGKTHDEPRPSRNQERWANTPPTQLEDAQQGYDEAKRVDDTLLSLTAASIARRAQSEADRQAKQAAFQQQQRETADAKILDPAKRAFLSSGGTESEFEQHKNQILEQSRFNAAVAAANSAVAESRPRQSTIA